MQNIQQIFAQCRIIVPMHSQSTTGFINTLSNKHSCNLWPAIYHICTPEM